MIQAESVLMSVMPQGPGTSDLLVLNAAHTVQIKCIDNILALYNNFKRNSFRTLFRAISACSHGVGTGIDSRANQWAYGAAARRLGQRSGSTIIPKFLRKHSLRVMRELRS